MSYVADFHRGAEVAGLRLGCIVFSLTHVSNPSSRPSSVFSLLLSRRTQYRNASRFLFSATTLSVWLKEGHTATKTSALNPSPHKILLRKKTEEENPGGDRLSSVHVNSLKRCLCTVRL